MPDFAESYTPYGFFESGDQRAPGTERFKREALAREWLYWYRTGNDEELKRFKRAHPGIVRDIEKGRYAYVGVTPRGGRPGLDQPQARPGSNPLYTNVRNLPPIGARQSRPGVGGPPPPGGGGGGPPNAPPGGRGIPGVAALLDPWTMIRNTGALIVLDQIYERLPESARAAAREGLTKAGGFLTGNVDLYVLEAMKKRRAAVGPGGARPSNVEVIPGSGPTTATYRKRQAENAAKRSQNEVFGAPPEAEPPTALPGGARPDRAPPPPDPRLIPGGAGATPGRPVIKPVKVTAKKIATPSVPGAGTRAKTGQSAAPSPGIFKQALLKGLGTFTGNIPELFARYVARPRGSSAPRFFVSPFAESPAQPAGQPSPLPLTAAETDQAGCDCTGKKKQAKPRKARAVCYSGTFIERSFGLQKTKRRKVKCLRSRKKRA